MISVSGKRRVTSEERGRSPEDSNSRTVFTISMVNQLQTTDERAGRRRQAAMALVMLLGLTVCVYWRLPTQEFVNIDDDMLVYRNAQVQAGLTSASVRWAMGVPVESHWHPLTWLSWMVDAEMYGNWAGGYKITNLMLHVLNVALLATGLGMMTGRWRRSVLAAAIFALHPLHVESVAWVTERKDVLSTLFGLSAVVAYAWYVRRPGVGRYALVASMFALALMSKPMWVTLPVLLLMLDAWPMGRMTKATTGKLILEKLPLLAGSVVVWLLTIGAESVHGNVAPLTEVGAGERVGYALLAYVGYLSKAIWPVNLAIFYPRPTVIPVMRCVISGSVLILISVAAVIMRRRAPAVLIGWMWFVAAMAPVIGIVSFGTAAMADRYAYLPMIGLWVAVVWVMCDTVAAIRIPRLAAAATALLLLLGLGAMTIKQVRYWDDSVTLFTHAVEVEPEQVLGYVNLGAALRDRGDLDNAAEALTMALRRRNNDPNALTTLGAVMQDMGRTDEAAMLYQRALMVDSENTNAMNNLAVILEERGAMAEALQWYQRAMARSPSDPFVHNNMAGLLEKLGRGDEAMAEYEAALRLRGDYVEPRKNLALLYARRGDRAAAVAQLEMVLRIRPMDPDAREMIKAIVEGGER